MVDFQERGWNEYLYWQAQDKKTLIRINELIKDIKRNGHEGIGKPEPLRGDLSGWWSRRIDDANRLVYRKRPSKHIFQNHLRA
ncbi:MAG: Txe/YoeB family addiction module toxin [Clostridiales Family XIII bacterium]|jgi:toxin YoeB|nr:Txe/YoeB family addiction module toxin [Clostridiales Family XIII bacterium]